MILTIALGFTSEFDWLHAVVDDLRTAYSVLLQAQESELWGISDVLLGRSLNSIREQATAPCIVNK